MYVCMHSCMYVKSYVCSENLSRFCNNSATSMTRTLLSFEDLTRLRVYSLKGLLTIAGH